MTTFDDQIIQEFRDNDGDVETMGFGRGLVLMHTVGANSGRTHVNPVAGIRQSDGSYLVAATAGGSPRNPAWYANLLAAPEIELETADEGTFVVRAEELSEPDRTMVYGQFEERSEGFRKYPQMTQGRVIPVFRLTPTA
jgi:deazaflavin-dependent oxidoreductase (nitroreductase family)